MSTSSILKQVCALRAGYGLASLFAPDAVTKRAGLPALKPDERYFNALFGGRDLTVVGVTLAALRAGREREAVLVNASCEATDLLALVQEIRNRGGIDTTVATGMAFNAVGILMSIRAARAL